MKLRVQVDMKQFMFIKQRPEHSAWDKIIAALWELHPDGLNVKAVRVKHARTTTTIEVEGDSSKSPFAVFWPQTAVGQINSRVLDDPVMRSN